MVQVKLEEGEGNIIADFEAEKQDCFSVETKELADKQKPLIDYASIFEEDSSDEDLPIENVPSSLEPLNPTKPMNNFEASSDYILNESFNILSPDSLVKEYQLPNGWRKKVVPRKKSVNERYDVYIFNPDNIKFRSRFEVMKYIQTNICDVDASIFDFSNPEAPSKKRGLNNSKRIFPNETSADEIKELKKKLEDLTKENESIKKKYKMLKKKHKLLKKQSNKSPVPSVPAV